MFVDKQVEAAVNKYLAPDYIQHNPYVPNGSQVLIDYFKPYFANNKDASIQVKRIIAEGNLVVVHSHWQKNKTERGQAVMDIFRVADGKIVEHWDVVQNIPETDANGNGMF